MASRCQRSILSCSRCRKRKMKCDRQLPTCSQCIASKSNCTGIAASAGGEVPRSIVQHLESEIARLETELIQDGQLEVVNASDILVQMPQCRRPGADGSAAPGVTRILTPEVTLASPTHDTQSPLRISILSSQSLQAIVSATLPSGTGADLLSRVRMGMTPSSARVGESNRTSVATSKAPKGNGSALIGADFLGSMPIDIIQRLMRKYLNTIQPASPFLVAATVMQQFQNVMQTLERTRGASAFGNEPLLVAVSHDFLIVYLVLAISITLGAANSGHEQRCMALSLSLFEEGIQHLHCLSSFPSDIAWLQTVLLVLLYATVFPRSANVWVLSGASMRSCLELGLHRESADSMDMSEEILDLRRRVFWAAYCMDRSICSALQRPLTTPDAAINTQVPSMMQNDTFIAAITFHRLLSEMLHVHFQHEPIPPRQTWEDWLGSMEDRLAAWSRAYSQASIHHEPIEFTMARGLMILHRPSPRVPQPSQRSLLVAFEASSTAARIHSEHIRSGFFRRPWLSAHYTLEAATTVLFCLRYGSATISERFNAVQVFQMTKLFTSNFLAIASQGWPEVNVYASVYERLLSPLLERVFLDDTSSMPNDRFGPAQDAELMRLLYPGPAHLDKLRFGLRRQREDFGAVDFNIFLDSDDDGVWSGGLESLGGGLNDQPDEQWWANSWPCRFGLG